jgi:HPt (histidine-containing phosphotransfer) domain-containing protein
MPQMDGIETTQKLRGMGYKGVIVALTANALVGNDKMFKQNGFDGFIAKPIDVVHLNTVLNKYIRDRYPDEAKKYNTGESLAANASPPEVNKKIMAVFRRDAEKAITALRETAADGDIKLFTTTAHAMKSALANIGEHDASETAFALEQAGLRGDGSFISANTEGFITVLEALIEPLRPVQSDLNTADVSEDRALLEEQLRIVKTACTDYNDTAAYTALDCLRKKPWKPETTAVIEEIYDMLFLHSDFEKAAERAALFLNSK